MVDFPTSFNFPVGRPDKGGGGENGPGEERSLQSVITKILLGFLGVVFVLFLLMGGCSGLENPEAGKIGVVRNGGPLDDKQIRGILEPGSGLAWTGIYSQTHYYPANQRNYIVTSDPTRGDRPGADVFRTPTRDSVNVGVEGQVLFTLNTKSAVIKELDNRYGTRTNPVVGSSNRLAPWEGDDGWGAFLDSWFRPTLDNALREEIAQFNCAELNAQCALVKNNTRNIGNQAETNVNFVKIQEQLQQSLQADLDKTLGGNFFQIQKVNLVGITLPEATQQAVDAANAEKAKVASARYQAQQAKYKAQSALAQARANRANPYAGIEQVFKALPPDSQPVINLSLGGSSKDLNLGFNK